MSKEATIKRLKDMRELVKEHEAKYNLSKEYWMTISRKDTVIQEAKESFKVADNEKRTIDAIESDHTSKRSSALIWMEVAAIAVSVIMTAICFPDVLGFNGLMTVFYVIGMFCQLPKVADKKGFSFASLLLYIPVGIFGAGCISKEGGLAVIPLAVLLVTGIAAPIIASNVKNKMSPEELEQVEKARKADAAIEASNQKLLQNAEFRIKTAEQYHKPLCDETDKLKAQMKKLLPELTDMIWVSCESLEKMIMALESGRADTLEKAYEYSSHIAAMRSEQRWREIERNLDDFTETLRMQNIKSQKQRELDRAKSKENESKRALDKTRSDINDIRKEYEI